MDMRKAPFLMLAAVATCAAAQTVHSLDRVPKALKTPEAKAAFAQQIEGRPAPDALGTRLPSELTAAQITRLLVPTGDKTPPSLIGARPMPGQPGVYVAIVCTGGNDPGPSGDKQCDQTNFGVPRPQMHVYLGLVQVTAGAPPRLIATPATFDGKVDWRDTILGDAPDDVDDAKDGVLVPDYVTAFDLAPYVIAPGRRAFGLVGSWNVGYAGGGAQYGALYLFAVENGALTEVLATPMWFSKNIAGDWHKDGTRDHEISEGANVLVVTAHQTNGHFDLRQKSRAGKVSRTFRWSTSKHSYEADEG